MFRERLIAPCVFGVAETRVPKSRFLDHATLTFRCRSNALLRRTSALSRRTLSERFCPPKYQDSLCASVLHRHALGMVLNLVGVAYYTGFWFRGEAFHSLYQIIQACRLIVLWNVLYLLGPTTSGERLRERVGKERGRQVGYAK